MPALKKVMNDEIQKYQGRIYYLDMRSNGLKPVIEFANWIKTIKDYDHFSFELHHVIKFTQYEKNRQWYKNQGLEMCLILIPKIMHQHLENPIYELPENIFYEKYQIHKHELLFTKKDYDCGNFPKILKQAGTELSFDDIDLSCFTDCEQRAERSADPFNANNRASEVCYG